MPLGVARGETSFKSQQHLSAPIVFLGAAPHVWLKVKNPNAPAVKRETEEIGCDSRLVSPLSGLGGFPAGNGAASSRSFSS